MSERGEYGRRFSSIVVSLAGFCGWAALLRPPPTARLSAVNRKPDSGDGPASLGAISTQSRYTTTSHSLAPYSHIHPIKALSTIHPKSEKVGGHCFLAHKNLAEKVKVKKRFLDVCNQPNPLLAQHFKIHPPGPTYIFQQFYKTSFNKHILVTNHPQQTNILNTYNTIITDGGSNLLL